MFRLKQFFDTKQMTKTNVVRSYKFEDQSILVYPQYTMLVCYVNKAMILRFLTKIQNSKALRMLLLIQQ